MGKKIKKSISLILVLSLLVSLVWVPKPVYAANVIQSIGDYLRSVGDWVYDHTYGVLDKKRAKYYSEAMPVQSQTTNYVDSNNEYNQYIYAGGDTYYYTPITYNDNDTYTYYDVDLRSYRTTNNFEYSPTYNMYKTSYTDNSMTYNYYMQDNYNYVSYIIECPEDPNENKYFEVYFELPDGRNSYNLRPDDLKGIVFSYEVGLYEQTPVDDTIGLWHLDGNLLNYVTTSSLGSEYSTSSYYDGYYSGAAKLNNSQHLYLAFDESLPEEYTLEWIQYNPDNTDSQTTQVASSSTRSYSGYIGSNQSTTTIRTSIVNTVGNYYYYAGDRGQYNKYAIVHSDGIDKLYINGHLSESSVLPTISDGYISFLCTSSNYTLSGKNQITPYSSPRTGTYRGENYSYTEFYRVQTTVFDILSSGNIAQTYWQALRDNGLQFYWGNYSDLWKTFSTFSDFNYITPSFYFTQYPYAYNYTLADNCTLNFNLTRYWNLGILIDEVRLSEGALYSEDYIPRNEPFDLSYAYTVPQNPNSNTIYVQSGFEPSRFQIGGVRSTNPQEGEVFISTTGTVGEMTQQYYEGIWHPIAAAVYFDNEFKSIEGFDFVNMMFVSGTSASGGSYVVEIPEEVTSLLEKIDQKLASILNPLKPVDDVTAIPFKDPGTDDEMQSFHLSDFFILLVYFILFAQILGDFVSTFVKLTDWVYHLWAIEALPGPLAGNEYFIGVWTILHGGTALGLPEPIKIFGVISLHDFMVMLFEIAFIGLMVAFYRKKLVNFKFPTLR